MQRLRNILVGTQAYSLFEDINLERIPLIKDGYRGFHFGQFSTEYLKYAAGEFELLKNLFVYMDVIIVLITILNI